MRLSNLTRPFWRPVLLDAVFIVIASFAACAGRNLLSAEDLAAPGVLERNLADIRIVSGAQNAASEQARKNRNTFGAHRHANQHRAERLWPTRPNQRRKE